MLYLIHSPFALRLHEHLKKKAIESKVIASTERDLAKAGDTLISEDECDASVTCAFFCLKTELDQVKLAHHLFKYQPVEELLIKILKNKPPIITLLGEDTLVERIKYAERKLEGHNPLFVIDFTFKAENEMTLYALEKLNQDERLAHYRSLISTRKSLIHLNPIGNIRDFLSPPLEALNRMILELNTLGAVVLLPTLSAGSLLALCLENTSHLCHTNTLSYAMLEGLKRLKPNLQWEKEAAL